jgi:hypothetical protein
MYSYIRQWTWKEKTIHNATSDRCCLHIMTLTPLLNVQTKTVNTTKFLVFIEATCFEPRGSKHAERAPGPVWRGAKNLAPTGIQIPDRPTTNESLYRLCYRGPHRTYRRQTYTGSLAFVVFYVLHFVYLNVFRNSTRMSWVRIIRAVLCVLSSKIVLSVKSAAHYPASSHYQWSAAYYPASSCYPCSLLRIIHKFVLSVQSAAYYPASSYYPWFAAYYPASSYYPCSQLLIMQQVRIIRAVCCVLSSKFVLSVQSAAYYPASSSLRMNGNRQNQRNQPTDTQSSQPTNRANKQTKPTKS